MNTMHRWVMGLVVLVIGTGAVHGGQSVAARAVLLDAQVRDHEGRDLGYLQEVVTAIEEMEGARHVLGSLELPGGSPREQYRALVIQLNSAILARLEPAEGVVVEKARGAVGMTSPVYGVVTHNELTQWGRLACAAVVSAVLKEAGQGVGIHYNCLGVRGALAGAGWDRVGARDVRSGDVAFWGEDMVTRPRHVGIVVGHTGFAWTVDNNSILRMVVLRPLSRVEWTYQHGMRR